MLKRKRYDRDSNCDVRDERGDINTRPPAFSKLFSTGHNGLYRGCWVESLPRKQRVYKADRGR